MELKRSDNVPDASGGRSPALPAAFRGESCGHSRQCRREDGADIAVSQPHFTAGSPGGGRLESPPAPLHRAAAPREPALLSLRALGRLQPRRGPRGYFMLCQW